MLLTGFFEKDFAYNTVGEWGTALLIILGAVIGGKILYWVVGKFVKNLTQKTKTKLDDLLVDKLEEPVILGLVIGCAWWALSTQVSFPVGIENTIDKLFHLAIAINVTWMVARTVDALIIEYIVPLTEKSESDLDDQIMPIARKGIRSVIWIMGIIVGMGNAGFDVTAMIAGLGIGGLALALAAQDTVKNIFGGIMIFVDKPFKMGERIKIVGFDGLVEEIGLRSTRLRTLEGRMIIIPNSQFSDNCVENVSLEPNRKVVLNLGMTYDTTPAQMQESMNTLQEIADANNDIEDKVLMSFGAFGDFALGITFIYYIKKESDLMQTPTDMNMAILSKFNEKGLEFAFPTQTLFTKEMA
jgi:MscS family membrane protein